jgi:hypothetical protein
MVRSSDLLLFDQSSIPVVVIFFSSKTTERFLFTPLLSDQISSNANAAAN